MSSPSSVKCTSSNVDGFGAGILRGSSRGALIMYAIIVYYVASHIIVALL